LFDEKKKKRQIFSSFSFYLWTFGGSRLKPIQNE